VTDTTVLAALYADPVLAARLLMPHWFKRKMPWVHRGLLAILLRRTDFLLNFGTEIWPKEQATWTEGELDLIVKWFVWEKADGTKQPLFFKRYDDRGVLVALDLLIGKHTIIMMPRGSAKTTISNFARILKILYKETKFTLLVSETGPHAKKQMDNILFELKTNEKIKQLFGELEPERNSPLPWTSDEAETNTGVYITARGRGGQVRGMNNKGNRPDDVTVDDLEDEESVSTPEQLDKTLTWVLKALLPVTNDIDDSDEGDLDEGTVPLEVPNLEESEATFTFLGTMLHRQMTLLKLAADPQFTFVRFGARLADESFLWPRYMNEKKWNAKKASYAMKGKVGAFYMEYGSEWRDEDSAMFKTEFFLNIVHPRSIAELTGRAIVIDPAISNKINADHCAFAVAGMTSRGQIHLLDSYGRVGMTPREQVDKYFELVLRWDTTHHGVESIAYQAALIHLLREEMFRKRRYFEITPITHSTKKTERIEGILQPRYASGYITHQRHFPTVLSQLLDWPNGGFDEVDAFAMAVTLLDPFAALAADPDKDLCDDEYEPLQGTWTAP
jgi:hypothetical protein